MARRSISLSPCTVASPSRTSVDALFIGDHVIEVQQGLCLDRAAPPVRGGAGPGRARSWPAAACRTPCGPAAGTPRHWRPGCRGRPSVSRGCASVTWVWVSRLLMGVRSSWARSLENSDEALEVALQPRQHGVEFTRELGHFHGHTRLGHALVELVCRDAPGAVLHVAQGCEAAPGGPPGQQSAGQRCEQQVHHQALAQFVHEVDVVVGVHGQQQAQWSGGRCHPRGRWIDVDRQTAQGRALPDASRSGARPRRSVFRSAGKGFSCLLRRAHLRWLSSRGTGRCGCGAVLQPQRHSLAIGAAGHHLTRSGSPCLPGRPGPVRRSGHGWRASPATPRPHSTSSDAVV